MAFLLPSACPLPSRPLLRPRLRLWASRSLPVQLQLPPPRPPKIAPLHQRRFPFGSHQKSLLTLSGNQSRPSKSSVFPFCLSARLHICCNCRRSLLSDVCVPVPVKWRGSSCRDFASWRFPICSRLLTALDNNRLPSHPKPKDAVPSNPKVAGNCSDSLLCKTTGQALVVWKTLRYIAGILLTTGTNCLAPFRRFGQFQILTLALLPSSQRRLFISPQHITHPGSVCHQLF